MHETLTYGSGSDSVVVVCSGEEGREAASAKDARRQLVRDRARIYYAVLVSSFLVCALPKGKPLPQPDRERRHGIDLDGWDGQEGDGV